MLLDIQMSGRAWSNCVYLAILLLVSSNCLAEESEHKWSITPLLGVSSPSIHAFNDGEFQSPLVWNGNVVIQTTGVSQPAKITVINPLPKIQYGAEGGLEVAYHVSGRDSVVLGYSTWDGSSTSTSAVVLPFQGIFSQVHFQRSGDLSYNAFNIGWRHKIYGDHGKWRVNTQMTLRELFDINYRENLVFLFQTGPAQSFKRIIQIIPKATGVMMMRFGINGEYFFTDWLSVGLHAGYSFGLQDFYLGNSTAQTDFQANDNVGAPLLPLRSGPNGRMQYLLPDGSTYRDLKLKMDGWDLLLGVTLHR